MSITAGSALRTFAALVGARLGHKLINGISKRREQWFRVSTVEGGMAQLRREKLTDAEWSIIDPLLQHRSRGVARVDDHRVLNGVFWRL